MKHLRRVFTFLVPLAILLTTPVLAAPGDTMRVSIDSSGGQANRASDHPSISSDGRYIAFSSFASNLVAGDTNGASDIFIHDSTTGTTTRVSVTSSGGQANTHSYRSSLSSDGRYVAFRSFASNLVAGDTNGAADIFVHDRTTGTTTRVSIDSSGTQANAVSEWPSISSDGRYVLFESQASNLVAGDTNGGTDIFIHDRTTGTTTRISVDSSDSQANDYSTFPAMSSDARYVAFLAYATNLVVGDTNGVADIFVHDRTTGTTTRVSVDSSGGQANNHSYYSSISSDGRYVAFMSQASNLVSADTNGVTDTFVRDRMTGTTTRVSVDSSGEQSNATSTFVSISSNGRFVILGSYATNLVAGDTNGVTDTFVHDRATGITTRVSVDSSGTQANGDSTFLSISSNGLYGVFTSEASNLVPEDTNGSSDIFVHELDFTYPTVIFGTGSVPPSDGANLVAGPSQLVVRFSENVLGDGSQHAANSRWNYMLLRAGPNDTFDTPTGTDSFGYDAACDSDHVTTSDDERIDISGITYDAAGFTATVTIDPLFAPLPNGPYRLYICGEHSIWDLSGLALNGGSNTAVNFVVGTTGSTGTGSGGKRSSLPSTGFAPNQVTVLPPQKGSYNELGDLWVEIPKLGVKMSIVGVPKKNDEWDVSWLGRNAGWLEGSAYPSWNGNSVLTGHVWNADNSAGPFVNLNTLWWGDKIIVHVSGQQYVYEVRAVKQVAPTGIDAMMKHEELPWLTLVSCKGYDEKTGEYRYRLLVRAVLVEVK